MANQKIRIKLKAYEHSVIDASAARTFPARFRSPPRRKS